MGNEGYLQIKIRDLNQEIEKLESRFNNLKSETMKLEEIKKQIDTKIELMKSIEKNIISQDIIKFQDKLYERIIENLKESMNNGLNKNYNLMTDKIINKIDTETYPYLDKAIERITKSIMNLQTNNFNEALIPFLNSKYNLKIPLIDNGKLMFNKKEATKWLKRKNGKTSQFK